MKTFNFIFALRVLDPVLNLVQKVCSTLHSPELDLLSAVTVVRSLKKSLTELIKDNAPLRQFS